MFSSFFLKKITLSFLLLSSLLTNAVEKTNQILLKSAFKHLEEQNKNWNVKECLKYSFFEDKDKKGLTLIINGDSFVNLDSLSILPVDLLTIQYTGIKTLDFLDSGRLSTNLNFLILANNVDLKNYNGLKNSSIRILRIVGAPGFIDASVVGKNVANLQIINTGIRSLKLTTPQQILHLELLVNRNLKDKTQINKMSNLLSLIADDISGIDFSTLKKLRYFELKKSNITDFPALPQKNISITIYSCFNLNSIKNLKGKSVNKMILKTMKGQLKKFVDVLLSMNISELTILSDDFTYYPELEKIKGLKKLTFNEKVMAF